MRNWLCWALQVIPYPQTDFMPPPPRLSGSRALSQYFPLCAERDEGTGRFDSAGLLRSIESKERHTIPPALQNSRRYSALCKNRLQGGARTKRKKQQTVSLDAPVGDSDDDYTLSDTLASTVGDTEESIWVKELRRGGSCRSREATAERASHNPAISSI